MSGININIFYRPDDRACMMYIAAYMKNIMPKVKKYGLNFPLVDVTRLSNAQFQVLQLPIKANLYPFILIQSPDGEVWYNNKTQINNIIHDVILAKKEMDRLMTMRQSKSKGRAQGRGQVDDPLGYNDIMGASDISLDHIELERIKASKGVGSDKEVPIGMESADDYRITEGKFGGRTQHQTYQGGAVARGMSTFHAGNTDEHNLDTMETGFISKTAFEYDDTSNQLQDMLKGMIIDPGSDGRDDFVAGDVVPNTVPSLGLFTR